MYLPCALKEDLGLKYQKPTDINELKHCRNVYVFLLLINGSKINFIDWLPFVNIMLYQCWKLNVLNLCIEKRLEFKFIKTIDLYELKH